MTALKKANGHAVADQDTPRSASWFVNLIAGIREGQALARRYDELTRQSIAELPDRRVTRADICRVLVRDFVRARHGMDV